MTHYGLNLTELADKYVQIENMTFCYLNLAVRA